MFDRVFLLEFDEGEGYSAKALRKKLIEAYRILSKVRSDLHRLDHWPQESQVFSAMRLLEPMMEELFDITLADIEGDA